MSELTLPEVRRTLYRVLLDAKLREDQATEQNVRYALHLLSAWSTADLEAASKAIRHTQYRKGKSTPRELLRVLDPDRAVLNEVNPAT